jgi:hypothetical protein
MNAQHLPSLEGGPVEAFVPLFFLHAAGRKEGTRDFARGAA